METRKDSMLIKILSGILFLGVIPCDVALFTLYKNADLGVQIAFMLNVLVCGVVAMQFLKNMQKQFLYEPIVTKYLTYFIAIIVLNMASSMISKEDVLIVSRTLSMICLCAYYLYGLYVFSDADSFVKSINIALLVLIVMSFVLYYVDYDNVSYIENATVRYFKGVTLNRNSYAEITLFYVASNLYLWTKSKKHGLYYIATTGLAVYTTYMTHSATSTVCMVLLVALAAMYHLTKKTISIIPLLVLYTVLFIAMVIIQSENIPLLEEIMDLFHKNSNLTGRTEIWKTTLDVISENPILGKGYDTYSMYRAGIPENDPHNGILYMLLTQGIAGTALFFWLFYKVLSKAKALVHDQPLFVHMYIFIVVWLVRGLVESVFAYTHFIFWIAIIIIEMVILEHEKAQELESEEDEEQFA